MDRYMRATLCRFTTSYENHIQKKQKKEEEERGGSEMIKWRPLRTREEGVGMLGVHSAKARRRKE
jgi:hypothetical protein